MALYPAKSKKYSLSWANSIYQTFKNKYARATETFNNFYGIPDDYPPKLLAFGSPKWRKYTSQIKKLDKWHQKQSIYVQEYPAAQKPSWKHFVELLDRQTVRQA